MEFEGEDVEGKTLEESFLEDNPNLRKEWDELSKLDNPRIKYRKVEPRVRILPIAVASSIDFKITELIGSYLVDCAATHTLLGTTDDPEDFGLEYMPRARLAEALGLLPTDVTKSLQVIGRIRNHFAHEPDPNVSSKVANKHLASLTDELFCLIMGDIAEDVYETPEAFEEARKRSKANFKADPEAESKSSLLFAWLVLSILITRAKGRMKRRKLKPLVKRSDIWYDTVELAALERHFGIASPKKKRKK